MKNSDYLACPFCGGHDLRSVDWADDSGEYEAIECAFCLGTAPARQWNTRTEAWKPGHIAPQPDQQVIVYYQNDDGTTGGPVITTPIRADGSHLIDGKPIHKPIAAWMPIALLSDRARQIDALRELSQQAQQIDMGYSQ